MFSKAEKIFAVAFLVVCAAVAIIGYAAPGPSSPPNRIWMDSAGGDVVFDHAYHISFTPCEDCHHGYQKGVAGQDMNCRSCHYYGKEAKTPGEDGTHPRYIGKNCVECHIKSHMDVVCNTCHAQQGHAYEFSGKVLPKLPKTVVFDTDAGKVTFDHQLHIGEDVGEPCATCHHICKGNLEMKGMDCRKNCRSCHYQLADKIPPDKDENHKRYIGASCTSCHDAEDCSSCHKE